MNAPKPNVTLSNLEGREMGDFNNLSETAEFNLIKSVTAVPSKRKERHGTF